MKELQQLKKYLKSAKENATKDGGKVQESNMCRVQYFLGMFTAFSLLEDEVDELLKSAHESKHRDFAHCANTLIGELPASLVGTNTVKLSAGEVSVQPGADRQNEQAKEVGTSAYDEHNYHAKASGADDWIDGA